MSKTIFIVVGIIMLVILAVLVNSVVPFDKNNIRAQITSPDNAVNILISNDGFQPVEITISRGTTIQWENIDSRVHWPASNI